MIGSTHKIAVAEYTVICDYWGVLLILFHFRSLFLFCLIRDGKKNRQNKKNPMSQIIELTIMIFIGRFPNVLTVNGLLGMVIVVD